MPKKEDMINFIENHETYYAMNPWNGIRCWAKTIKLHHLNLTNIEFRKALDIICDEDLSDDLYQSLRELMDDFRMVHGIEVYTNGRSGGYLCLDRQSFPIIKGEELRLMSYPEVKNIYDVLKDFARLADDLLATLKYYCTLNIKEETYSVVRKRKIFAEAA